MSVAFLQEQTGIVTGGASGKGFATTQFSGWFGTNVVIADIDPEAGNRFADE